VQTDRVISDLYAAANGRADWQTVLGNVAELLGCLFVQVQGFDKRNGQLMFSSTGGNVTPQATLEYFRYYNTIDPRPALGLATPVDQWMHCHEHLDDGYVASSVFYQDFLIPLGIRYCSATKIIDDDGVQFFIAMLRSNTSQPVSAAEMPLHWQMKHHFTEAFRNLVHLRETYAELGMARELMGQFAHPMLLVDEAGSIWHRNEPAQALLQRGDPVMDQNGYLTCRNRADQQALAEALQSLHLAGPAGAGMPPPPAQGRFAYHGQRGPVAGLCQRGAARRGHGRVWAIATCFGHTARPD